MATRKKQSGKRDEPESESKLPLTSREELQSLNEEMMTVNAELTSKTDMLTRANDDLKNYLNRTDIAIIFLDEELNIRSYTPASTDVFSIRDIDIARPLEEITSRLDYANLIDDAREVLRTLQPKEIEVRRRDGRWYMMRILPYLTAQNVGGGLVMSFLDIDKQRQAVDELARANRELEELARFPQENPNPVLRVSRDGAVLYANAACSSILDSFSCQPGQLLPERYREIVAAVLDSDTSWSIEIEAGERRFTLQFVPVTASGYVNIYGLDITKRKKAEEALAQAAQQWQETFDAIPDLISIHDKEYNILKVNRAFTRMFGMTAEQLVGKKCYEVFHESNEPILACLHRQTMQTGQLMSEEVFEPRLDAYFDIATAPIVSASGEITSSIHIARNVTARKRTEERIAFQSHLLDAIEDVIITTDVEGRIIFWGRGAVRLLGWQPDDAIRQMAIDLLVPEELTPEAHAIGEQLRSGKGWSGEMTAKRRDGTLAP
ncbi:MAG: PAS domain S-box protein, partial [Dehalococcoidales bacterium]|nr:PAS domain S-box protein [Dehalococcoidales bacterium]